MGSIELLDDQAIGSTTVISLNETSQRGPVVDGVQTTLTVFTPEQLSQSSFLPSLMAVSNAAYVGVHQKHDLFPKTLVRISSEESLVKELQSEPGTFTYIVHSNDVDVIATISMRRCIIVPTVHDPNATAEQLAEIRRLKTFKRTEALPESIEAWEMTLVVVSPDAQGQGLASFLIQTCEAEVVRRSCRLSRTKDLEIRSVLSCINEINGNFYRKRGYTLDYEVYNPQGTLGSKKGFHITHMSKKLDTDL